MRNSSTERLRELIQCLEQLAHDESCLYEGHADELNEAAEALRELVMMKDPRSPFACAVVPVEPSYQMCKAMGLPWEEPPFPERWKAMLKTIVPDNPFMLPFELAEVCRDFDESVRGQYAESLKKFADERALLVDRLLSDGWQPAWFDAATNTDYFKKEGRSTFISVKTVITWTGDQKATNMTAKIVVDNVESIPDHLSTQINI